MSSVEQQSDAPLEPDVAGPMIEGTSRANSTAEGSVRSKSPLFESFQALRYQRQTLIRNLNNANGRHLICYVGSLDAIMERDDVLAFADLLHHVPAEADIDLMLHTVGGDTDVAEKLAGMLWSRIGKSGSLRVIVPDFAKSAGTLLALAADEIIMSDTSELGPIDPQVVRRTPSGSRTTAVQHQLEAHKRAKDALAKNPADAVAAAEFSLFDPADIVLYETVLERSRRLSDKHLKQGMFRKGQAGAWTAITTQLLDTARWKTHSQVIGYNEAEEIGMNVVYRSPNDAEWQDWWRLHCLQRLTLDGDVRRLFESDPVCLALA